MQLSRHPDRPYTLDHIRALTGDTFMELHCDRTVKDDKAMVGGLGKIGDQSFMFIGQQKGYNTKTRQYRNFGMANPEGYRKALRLMKTAEKFMKKSAENGNQPNYYLAYAQILYRNKKKDEAKKAATKALEMAKEQKKDAGQIEYFLQSIS